jgi:hypothetical protein
MFSRFIYALGGSATLSLLSVDKWEKVMPDQFSPGSIDKHHVNYGHIDIMRD